MTPHELQNLIAKLESKLARQNAALQETSAEIKILEDHGAKDPKEQVLIQPALNQLRIKRLRQYNATMATQGFLKVLGTPTKSK